MGRGVLRSFVVNTMDDQRELQGIFARHFRSGKPPNITRLQFRSGRIPLHDGYGKLYDNRSITNANPTLFEVKGCVNFPPRPETPIMWDLR